jgi:hypothetical protein
MESLKDYIHQIIISLMVLADFTKILYIIKIKISSLKDFFMMNINKIMEEQFFGMVIIMKALIKMV